MQLTPSGSRGGATGDARSGSERGAEARDVAHGILATFQRSGAILADTEILQPADLLLDLYGEDIRARAFVTRDPVRGEFILRPDFTVPVARKYMAGAPGETRFTYLGPVWRIQPPDSVRSPESLQVGYEIFGSEDRAGTDAEVFGLFHEVLAADTLDVVVGDMSILLAAISCLETPERRKVMLRRHLWRPGRFRKLLDRFSRDRDERGSPNETRAGANEPGTNRSGGTGDEVAVHIGLREPTDIAARHRELEEDARTPPISRHEVATIEAVLDLGGTMTTALDELERLLLGTPSLESAVAAFSDRRDALRSVSVDVDNLRFASGHGRRTMEYYDGFVFGFRPRDRHGWPAVASGGRYDALTGRLGQGRSVPAVGGVIRPETLTAIRAGLT